MIVWDGYQMVERPDTVVPPATKPTSALQPPKLATVTVGTMVQSLKSPAVTVPATWSGTHGADIVNHGDF